MNAKDKKQIRTDFQDAGVKKAKRIASIIYIMVMTFIVAGSWLHQQQTATEMDTDKTIDYNRF